MTKVSTVWVRLRVVAWIGIGAAGAVGGLGLLVVGFPARLADRSAYERAERCRGAVARDCWVGVPAVVERTRVSGGKSNDFYVFVRAGDPELSGRIGVPRDTPVFHALRPGDQVTLRVFRGRVARIDAMAGRLVTDRTPDVDAAGLLALGTLLLSWGAFGVLGGVGIARRSRYEPGIDAGDAVSAVRWYGVVLLVAIGSVPMFVAVVAFDVHDLSDALAWGAVPTAVLALLAWRSSAGARLRASTQEPGELEESG